MLGIFKRKNEQEIHCPVSGRLIPLCEVHDEAFSNGYLGEGFAVVPEDGMIVSPISGKIEVAFPTGHAYGIKNDKVEVMVHIGIDTVNLKGIGFESKVVQGQTVKEGDPLVTVDLNELRRLGYDLTTVVIYTDGHKSGGIAYDHCLERGALVEKIDAK